MKPCKCLSKPDKYGWVYMDNLLEIKPSTGEAMYTCNEFFATNHNSDDAWTHCPLCGRQLMTEEDKKKYDSRTN